MNHTDKVISTETVIDEHYMISLPMKPCESSLSFKDDFVRCGDRQVFYSHSSNTTEAFALCIGTDVVDVVNTTTLTNLNDQFCDL